MTACGATGVHAVTVTRAVILLVVVDAVDVAGSGRAVRMEGDVRLFSQTTAVHQA